MRFGVVGVDLQGLVNKVQGRSPVLLPHIVHMGESTQVQIVGVKVIRALALGAIDFSLAQRRLDGPNNAVCDLVLKLEDVGEIPVVPLGPDVGSVAASINCPVTRTRLPARRMEPSRTYRTPSCSPISFTFTALPLNTKLEFRAMTNSHRMRESAVRRSSVMPSEKYSSSTLPLMLMKGRTAMEGLSGSGGLGVAGYRLRCWRCSLAT